MDTLAGMNGYNEDTLAMLNAMVALDRGYYVSEKTALSWAKAAEELLDAELPLRQDADEMLQKLKHATTGFSVDVKKARIWAILAGELLDVIKRQVVRGEAPIVTGLAKQSLDAERLSADEWVDLVARMPRDVATPWEALSPTLLVRFRLATRTPVAFVGIPDADAPYRWSTSGEFAGDLGFGEEHDVDAAKARADERLKRAGMRLAGGK